MREILFRGKTYDGKWVIGDFEHFHLSDEELVVYINKWGEKIDRVIPDTVGQYTGLTDKNGKKIFEGDIISERPPMNTIAYIGYVAYDDEAALYRFMINNDTKFNGVLLGTYSRSYTVIGNIHDNPELLKGDNNDKNNNL